MKKQISISILFSLLLTGCGNTPESDNAEIRFMTDKQATPETVELYNQLFNLVEKGIMVGHQDDLAYGHAWYGEAGRSDVKDVTGDYPAVIGWELGHLEIGADYNLDSIYFSDMKRYIRETHQRGGITTISWHGDNIVTGNTAWDCDQDYVVKSVLPNGENHTTYRLWLDRLADFFLDLKDTNGNYIPVIFRMYHEHTGAWFWWGSKQCTPDEYKQLWIMTVEYLRDTKEVHNLIYAYSPSETESEAHFLERYPGDDYVDIIGFDCYAPGKTDADIASYKRALQQNLDIITGYAAKSGKLPVIGETGMETLTAPDYFTGIVYPIISQYKPGWVLFWRNAWETGYENHYYVPFEGHPHAGDFVEFISRPGILMNKDISF